jgi:hypothetical protein
MNRAIVLLVCLSAAAAIVAYSHPFNNASDRAAVVAVAQRTPEPLVRAPVTPPPRAIETPADRASIARELQRELKRVGCYSGEINGAWTTSSRMAMKAFTDRVNATLPIDQPDYVLLSLLQGYQDKACGAGCPTGQTASEGGVCTPNAVIAATAKTPTSQEAKTEAMPEKANTTLASSVPTAAAAAIAATAAAPKQEPKARAADERARAAADERARAAADERARAAAVSPPPHEAASPLRDAPSERFAGHGGPMPPDGIRERGPRRSANRASSRPPKIVRNFLRSLGFR